MIITTKYNLKDLVTYNEFEPSYKEVAGRITGIHVLVSANRADIKYTIKPINISFTDNTKNVIRSENLINQ